MSMKSVNCLEFHVKHWKLRSECSEVLTKCHTVTEQSYQKLDRGVLKAQHCQNYLEILEKKILEVAAKHVHPIVMHSIIGLTLLQYLSSVFVLQDYSSLKQHSDRGIRTSLMLIHQQISGPIL